MAETVDNIEIQFINRLATSNGGGFFNDTDCLHNMSLFYIEN
jgi:hypothetical protein